MRLCCPVDDFQAVRVQADHLAGASSGVAQDPVDGLLHGLQVGGRDRPGPAGGAEQVQVGVELTDHRVRQRLAELVLVGLGADPDLAAGRPEGVRHVRHQPGDAAVLDDLEELVEQQVAVCR